MYVDPVRPVNQARFVFHNPRATEFSVDWESVANDTVAGPAHRRRTGPL
jgi:transcription regulator MmyB-like protein